MLKILVVDDDEVTRKLLQEILVKEGYAVQLAASGEDAVRAVRKEVFPIIVSDIRMVELDGLAVLREVKKADKRSAVILMTGFGSMEGAVEAIQDGAFDYVSKPFKMNDLKAVIARAAKHWESLVAGPAAAAPATARMDAAAKALIGKSPVIVEVYKTLARAALSASNVLIRGERGTGKELVARAIHDNSQRRQARFVSVSCAMPESALESELFGQLEQAAGGTLFLEEVGELPAAAQVRLLRSLQDSGAAPDVRVISATRDDLEERVRAGRFREDLFYLLNVISIVLPPLRDRREDIPALVEHFLPRYAGKNGKTVSHVSEDAMRMLREHAWPGNIRELENAIERAVAMTGTHVLYPEDFPAELRPAAGAAEGEGGDGSLESLEKAHIVRVLQETQYNKSRASEILGIDRATLYRKAQRYGIDLRGK
jgi:DNA-binding NtrC family response regulator